MRKDKKRSAVLASEKSLKIQVVIGFALLIGFILNLYVNWNYFSSYSGCPNAGYFIAHTISNFTLYGLLAVVTSFIGTLFFFVKSNKDNTKKS